MQLYSSCGCNPKNSSEITQRKEILFMLLNFLKTYLDVLMLYPIPGRISFFNRSLFTLMMQILSASLKVLFQQVCNCCEPGNLNSPLSRVLRAHRLSQSFTSLLISGFLYFLYFFSDSDSSFFVIHLSTFGVNFLPRNTYGVMIAIVFWN